MANSETMRPPAILTLIEPIGPRIRTVSSSTIEVLDSTEADALLGRDPALSVAADQLRTTDASALLFFGCWL